MLEGDAWLHSAVLERIRQGRWRARATLHAGTMAVSDEYLVEAPPHATIDARAFIVHFCRDPRSIASADPKITAFADARSAVAAFKEKALRVTKENSAASTLTVEWQ